MPKMNPVKATAGYLGDIVLHACILYHHVSPKYNIYMEAVACQTQKIDVDAMPQRDRRFPAHQKLHSTTSSRPIVSVSMQHFERVS